MISSDFEHFLGNLSFVCLFAMVIWYWVKVVFSLSPLPRFVGTLGMGAANLSLAGLLISRWLASGHFPLSNLFESLLFLSWGFTGFHLILEGISKADFFGILTSPMAFLTNVFATLTLPHELQKATALIPALQSNWLMMHVTIMMMSYVALISGSLLAIGFLVISHHDAKTSKTMTTCRAVRWPSSIRAIAIEPLSKGTSRGSEILLQSARGTESSTMRYQAALAPETGASQGTLQVLAETHSVPLSTSSEPLRGKVGDKPCHELLNCSLLSTASTPLQLSEKQLAKTNSVDQLTDLSVFAQTLDNLSYRTLGLGFPLLTVGILSGAVWANEAWGSYWSWDPKETWALITWLVFAIYLHTRLGRGWKGTRPAAIAAAGFFIVWICYLGVNLLGTGLHSYGWLRSVD